MLIQDKQIFLLFFILLFSFSCKKRENDLSEKTSLFKTIAKKKVQIPTYNHVYMSANDSLKSWTNNNIEYYEFIKKNRWQIDSLICFNQNADRCVMALLIQSTFYKDQEGDGITFFYGAKINNEWYFFSGAFIVIPREYYQEDTRTPLSFEKLHEIAMEEVFDGYLIEKETKKDLGWWKNIFAPEYKYEYDINENFFKQMESRNQDGTYASFKTFEEFVLWQVKLNWKEKN